MNRPEVLGRFFYHFDRAARDYPSFLASIREHDENGIAPPAYPAFVKMHFSEMIEYENNPEELLKFVFSTLAAAHATLGDFLGSDLPGTGAEE